MSSCCACKPTLHGGCVYEACLLELKPTSGEHREIRNAADVVLCCKSRESFRIDFQNDCTPGEVPSGLRHVRRRHPARSAPRSPEVDQNRNLALANDLVEFLFVDFDRLATAGSSALQAPHLPTSERCLAGMRFGLPQDEQFRMTGMGLF